MPDPELPADAPPSYAQATGSTSAASHLQVPNARNNIPVAHRRSMEDEGRPLPQGWKRQYDASNDHQFFVDTTKTPPRSIWHHPYDDDEYLGTLSSEERERIQAETMARNRHDNDALSTDGSANGDAEGSHDAYAAKKSKKQKEAEADALPSYSNAGEGSSSQAGQKPQEKQKLGRKLKDKLTGMTHEQRVAEREQRAREEEEEYRQYMAMRGAMKKAIQSGQPSYAGRDRNGKDIYIEPPGGMGGYSQRNGVYYSPYRQGIYADPNVRVLRPADPYSRPYGRGYGGGYGLPLAGGLAGGLLLGGALGGFGL